MQLTNSHNKDFSFTVRIAAVLVFITCMVSCLCVPKPSVKLPEDTGDGHIDVPGLLTEGTGLPHRVDVSGCAYLNFGDDAMMMMNYVQYLALEERPAKGDTVVYRSRMTFAPEALEYRMVVTDVYAEEDVKTREVPLRDGWTKKVVERTDTIITIKGRVLTVPEGADD